MPDADRFTLSDLPPLRHRRRLLVAALGRGSSDSYAVRKNVALPFSASTDRGVMATVYAGGGYGYAATADTSPAGLAAALERAAAWARATAKLALIDSRTLPRPAPRGEYASPSIAAPIALASRMVRAPDGRIARGRDRPAHRRLGGVDRRA